MKKTLLILTAVLTLHATYSLPSRNAVKKISPEQANALLKMTKEEAFQKTAPSNIVSESMYIEMVKEGWTTQEIIRLTDEYVAAHKPALKQYDPEQYIEYTKSWRPYNLATDITNHQTVDTTDPKVLQKARLNVLATPNANTNYPRLFYTVDNRKAGIRNPGMFRHNAFFPSGGRIRWIALHPENPDRLMVVGDADGIWRTDDMGKHWDCITDRIPNRYDRVASDNYSIPVDPDNWNHIFAFMSNNTVYETEDGGGTWKKRVGATHKAFRRGYCFRDATGKLKFIGGADHQLWLSNDTCKTWISVKLTTAQLDRKTSTGGMAFTFQEISFHPTNRNTIFVPGSRGILRSTDGGKTWNRMSFKVYGATTEVVRVELTDLFPLATADAPMFLNINPANSNEMWAGISILPAGNSALYKSNDGGLSWITLNEPSAVPAIGSGKVFGNQSPWTWLGGLAVNFVDQRYVYGCSMSSAESKNYGVNFTEYAWDTRHTGFYPDGNIYPVSACRHNADNQVLIGHKSGRIFRGGDGGLFVKDSLINAYEWTNIIGDMGNVISYSCATNEFGDYSVVENAQDIDAHTYREGRWGVNRGLEGNATWINPFSGEEHFSGTCNGRTDILNQTYGSWNERAWTKADVCTGNWYIRRENSNPTGNRFFVIKDFGRTSIGLDNTTAGFVQDFALSRDVPGGKLFILRKNKLYVSTDGGKTFSAISMGTIIDPTRLTVNPDNSNEIYLAKTGSVYRTLNGGTSWQTISTTSLTGAGITSLYYHEGSGDLYYVSGSIGIFIQEAGTSSWRLWMAGYNKGRFTDAVINYTTQEMILSDYGRGVWTADLENPADRFLKNGFALKQISNINAARTFGIDITYTIPLYYYFKWYVNGVLQTNENGQYFTSSTLVAGDKVKLDVTLRESPDVTTHSAEHVIVSQTTSQIADKAGNYLSSNRLGRVDLEYVDHFFGNFSLQMWVNPKSDGVILANRQVNYNAVKGFYLAVESGQWVFKYTPTNYFEQPLNEKVQTVSFTLSGGAVNYNSWNQVSITHDRTGNICLYINGELKATQARALPNFTLNNGIYLSLFADGYEMNPIDASVDELKIWNEVLDQTSVRKSMFGTINPSNAKLIYYNDFNAATLATQKERFSQKGMAPRTKAVVTVDESTLAICAADHDYKAVGTAWTPFMKNGVKAMEIKSSNAAFLPNAIGLFYNYPFMGSETNLLPSYFTIYPNAFGIQLFDVKDFTKLVDLKFYLDPALAATYQKTVLYSLDLNAGKEIWTALAPLVYNATDQSLSILGVKASDVNNKRLAIVIDKPAIVLNPTTMNANRELSIYTPDLVNVPFNASLVGGIATPSPNYGLMADNLMVKSVAPLTFSNNVANTTATVQLADNTPCNQQTAVTIAGQDPKLMPYTFTVVNKIAPKTNDFVIQLKNGAATVGGASTYASLNNSNKATFMTWVRLQDSTLVTGDKDILRFSGLPDKRTSIYLNNGTISTRWNTGYWLSTASSSFKLTKADIGEWMHIAMTVSPTGIEFYLNGKKGATFSNAMGASGILSGLVIGNTTASYDQVAIWNRTLSAEEIVKYMHSRTYLNEPGLLSYITFENEENGGGFKDLVSNSYVLFGATVATKQPANIPFDFVSQQVRTKGTSDGVLTDGVAFTMPSVCPSTFSYYTSNFGELPYNCIDIKHPTQVALEKGYRTIAMGAIHPFTTERLLLSIENPDIISGDSTIFYARALGSEKAFNIRQAVLAEVGKAVFDLPATIFNENLSYMFYRKPKKIITQYNATADSYRYKLSVDNGFCTIENLRGNAAITIIDLRGHIVSKKLTHETLITFELPRGAYLVKIEEFGSCCMTKIIL